MKAVKDNVTQEEFDKYIQEAKAYIKTLEDAVREAESNFKPEVNTKLSQ